MPTPNSAPSYKDVPEAAPAAAEQAGTLQRACLGMCYALLRQFGSDVAAQANAVPQVENPVDGNADTNSSAELAPAA